MNFSQLLSEYMWTRSYTRKELAKYLGVTESQVVKWHNGELPTPIQAHNIQTTLDYPRIDFWTVYFNSLIIDLGEDDPVKLQDYEEHQAYIKNSLTHRRLLKHNSTPSDEVWMGISDSISFIRDYQANPQKLSIVLDLKIIKNDKLETIPKELESLAKSLELEIKDLESLIEGRRLPSIDKVEHILKRTAPGYERHRVLFGYLSSVVEHLNLKLFIKKENSPAYLNQLTNMAKRNPDIWTAFREKKKNRKKAQKKLKKGKKQ